ncbi:MAG: hypothetical protein Q9219_004276 [cf. Caloplaca sp. 3 TL-2023]
MGISGLLPLLKSIQKPCNLKKFAGQTIGVDAYGWLHRGTVACAIDLALGTPTTKFVDFSENRVRMLIHFGVTPYLVFDGDYLPSKSSTEAERAKKREESKRLGLELHRMGKISQAHLELQKAVDVTPEMARQLIERLKKLGVQYIVAPYEADSQLAYLEKKGIIHGILSEDSDLLVFGAKRLLTKLDQYGDCVEIRRDDFTSCKDISLVGWTDADFRRMAILSGCDYLASINKMGLKTAYRLVRKHKSIERILRILQFDGQYHVPGGYLEAFRRAELTFLHQRVFCPIANDIVMMTQPVPGNGDETLDFLGTEVAQEIALGVVRGDLHPTTKQPIVIQRRTKTSPESSGTNARRRTLGTPSDLKPNKSIDTFFKAQRTPLAELDPNSFTPSPSQQRLLRQATGTWASSPVPPRPGLPRSSVSTPLSGSLSNTVRLDANTVAGPSSAPHPPKRRRLCSDSVETAEVFNDENMATERSKFFTPSRTCSGLSTKSSRRTARGKAADFNIWSDDSIEDAMSELPNPQMQKPPEADALCVSASRQDDVKRQPSGAIACIEDRGVNSQPSTTSQSTSKTEDSRCTSVSSIGQSHHLATIQDTHVRSGSVDLEKEHHYQVETDVCQVQQQEVIRGRTLAEDKTRLQKKGSITPLQRLGASALNRSSSCNSLLNTTTKSEKSHPGEDPQEQLPRLVNVLRSPAQKLASPMEAYVIKGSEDMMVPDSEAESEGSQEDTVPERPRLNLEQFAFNG